MKVTVDPHLSVTFVRNGVLHHYNVVMTVRPRYSYSWIKDIVRVDASTCTNVDAYSM